MIHAWKEVSPRECFKWLVNTEGVAMVGDKTPSIAIRVNFNAFRFEFWNGRAWFNFSNVDMSETIFFIPESTNE